MDVVKPQNDEESPIFMSISCFIVGGAILMFAIIIGTANYIKKKGDQG